MKYKLYYFIKYLFISNTFSSSDLPEEDSKRLALTFYDRTFTQ